MYVPKAVPGHGEWIAYMLHHRFSSRRDGRGSICRALEETGVQTFWEQLLDFYKLPPDTRDKQGDKHTDRVRSCSLVERKFYPSLLSPVMLPKMFTQPFKMQRKFKEAKISIKILCESKKTDELLMPEELWLQVQPAHLFGKQPAFIQAAAAEKSNRDDFIIFA